MYLASPAVATTSTIPSSRNIRDTSNVPAPKSNITTFLSGYFKSCNASVKPAAVGSLIMRIHFSEATVAASDYNIFKQKHMNKL